MEATRSERLLAELGNRYELGDEFVDKLRPVVEQILAGEMQEDRRVGLLEILAETCQRDLEIRNATERARGATQALVGRLTRLIGALRIRKDDSGDAAAADPERGSNDDAAGQERDA